MKLEILIKCVYGNELYYPLNDAAKSLAKISGKKTFSIGDLKIAHHELGFELEFVDAASFIGDKFAALAA